MCEFIIFVGLPIVFIGMIWCIFKLFPSLGEHAGNDPRSVEEIRSDAVFNSSWNTSKMLAHRSHGAHWRTWTDNYSSNAYMSSIIPEEADSYCNKNLLY